MTIESWRFCYLRQRGEYLPKWAPGSFCDPLGPIVASIAAEAWAKRYAYLLIEPKTC